MIIHPETHEVRKTELMVPYRFHGSWKHVDFILYERARTGGLEECLGVATWPEGTLAHLTLRTDVGEYFAWLARTVTVPEAQHVFLVGGRNPDSVRMITEIREQLRRYRFLQPRTHTCEDGEYTGRDMVLQSDGRVIVMPYAMQRHPANNQPEKMLLGQDTLI